MEDLNKIQEFFSKPLEETTFKVGQKVTYLGHPAVVTATKEHNGRNYVSVSYDKGKGKTKASDILTTDGSIKPLKEMMSLDDQAKAYFLEKFKKGEISSLPEDPKAAFLAQMTKDEMEKDAAQYRRETGLEENQTESKFKKGDKITYYGNKGVVNSAKYNTFAKDWDYTISYIEDGTRKGESGVRDKELKSSPINEAKFTDYSNNELAAYAKELSKQRADAASKGQSDLVSGINKEIEAAVKELKKRSQKLKDLSRTDVKEPVGEEVKGVPVEKTPATITRKEWDKTPKNDKAIINGIAYVKRYDRVIGTYMAPIKIVNEEENLDENFAKFDTLKMAVNQHEKGAPYYDKTRLINIFNQLSSSDQVKAKKQYSGYFEESLDEAFGEDYYIRVRLKDAPEAMKAFDDFIGKNDFRLNKGGDQFSTDDVKAGIRLYRHLTDRLIKVYDHNLPLEDKYLPVYEGGKWGYQEAAKNMIKFLQNQLDDMGVEYEMSGNRYAPFKTIYKPINKSDDWYVKFEDLIDRANLGSVVKTGVKEVSNDYSPISYAKLVAKGRMDIEDAMKETGYPYVTLMNLVKKIKAAGDSMLQEAFVPRNIAEFAERKGVSSLVKTVAGWAEKVGKRIVGGTAIGKNYDTLILDMTYQGSEIRINTEYETVELYDEPVRTFAQFKRVYEENQEENLDEVTNDQGGPEYKKEDLLAQKIFGIKYFNWLSDWEQFHLVNKYNLDKNIITKENKDSTYNEYSEVGYKKVGEAKGGELDEKYFIEVSVRDARKALDIYADEYSNADIETYGSNVYASNDFGDIYDLYMSLMANGIEILDSSNFDEEPFDFEDEDEGLFEADMPYNKKVDIIKSIIKKVKAQGEHTSLDDLAKLIAGQIKIDSSGKSLGPGEFKVIGGKLSEEEGYSKYLVSKDNPKGKTPGLTPDIMSKILMKIANVDDIDEAKLPGLWANIRAKRERGEKPSSKGSKAYKTAVAAGKRINKEK